MFRRRITRRLSILALPVCSLAWAAPGMAQQISLEELVSAEKSAVEMRKSISTGRFVCSVRYNTFAPNPDYINHELRYEVLFKPTKSRADFSVILAGKPGDSNSTIFTNDSFIRAPLSNSTVVQVFGPARRPQSTIEIPDPLLLGFVAWNFSSISQFGLEEHLLRANRADVEASKREVKGEPVIEASYNFGVGDEATFTTYLLAVNKGFQPVFISTWSGEGESRVSRTLDIELQQIGIEKIWIPRQVVLRSKTGDTLTTEEVTTIENADIDTQIDDEEFSLAGLGLERGRLVSNDGREMWWTGDGLVPRYLGQDSYEDLATERALGSPVRKWLMGINAVILAVIAAIILWIRFSKHARQ